MFIGPQTDVKPPITPQKIKTVIKSTQPLQSVPNDATSSTFPATGSDYGQTAKQTTSRYSKEWGCRDRSTVASCWQRLNAHVMTTHELRISDSTFDIGRATIVRLDTPERWDGSSRLFASLPYALRLRVTTRRATVTIHQDRVELGDDHCTMTVVARPSNQKKKKSVLL